MKDKTRKRAQGRNTGQTARFGNAREWVAVGTLAAYAAMGAKRPALAAVWKTDPNADGAAATLPLKRFDIPAGPLEATITAYEKTTGLSVKIVLPGSTPRELWDSIAKTRRCDGFWKAPG